MGPLRYGLSCNLCMTRPVLAADQDPVIRAVRTLGAGGLHDDADRVRAEETAPILADSTRAIGWRYSI
ncbi:MAG: hypothetical protein ABSF49_14725 [Roseiarcus sp.]